MDLAGIRERIGYPTKGRRDLLTRVIEEPEEELHKVEYFLNIARACGMKVRDTSYEFFVADADRTFIRELLRKEGIGESDHIVVICPAGNWEPKRWPKADFAKFGDLLAQRQKVRIVIAAAPKDAALAGE